MYALPRLLRMNAALHRGEAASRLISPGTMQTAQLYSLRHLTTAPSWGVTPLSHSPRTGQACSGHCAPAAHSTSRKLKHLGRPVQWCRRRRGMHSAAATAQSDADAAAPQPAAVEQPRLVLLDAFAVLYRAHFSFGPSMRLTTAAGEDTSVLYGFLSVLLALLEGEHRPSHLGVVLDAGGSAWGAKNFRHELYAGYKGQRPPMPEEIGAALPKLVELLELMRIPTFQSPGLEADDIIATLAVRGLAEGCRVTIASPDKDFFQLLRPGLDILRPGKPAKGQKGPGLAHYTADSFREQFGLEPHQFTDMLALCGDASDNVPGVRGVGPKTAAPLLQEHGDVEGVLAAAAQDPSPIKRKGVRETLASEQGAAAARLSRRLVALQTDVDVPVVRVPLQDLLLQTPNDSGSAALAALGTLEFRQHARRLAGIFGSSDVASGLPAAALNGR